VGEDKNIEWYEQVIGMLDEALENEEDMKVLVKVFISLQIKAELDKYFGINSIAAELLLLDWAGWFNDTYKIAPETFRLSNISTGPLHKSTTAEAKASGPARCMSTCGRSESFGTSEVHACLPAAEAKVSGPTRCSEVIIGCNC
jgi:hypothetical protein